MDSKEKLSSLPEADLIVLSADSPNLIRHVNEYAVRTRTPYINIGYVQDIAVWGPFVIPGKTGCFACQSIVAGTEGLSPSFKEKIQKINAVYQAPSFGPINLMASSYGLLDIFRFLGKFGEIQSLNKRIGFWTHNHKFEIQDCAYNPDCKICGNLASET